MPLVPAHTLEPRQSDSQPTMHLPGRAAALKQFKTHPVDFAGLGDFTPQGDRPRRRRSVDPKQPQSDATCPQSLAFHGVGEGDGQLSNGFGLSLGLGRGHLKSRLAANRLGVRGNTHGGAVLPPGHFENRQAVVPQLRFEHRGPQCENFAHRLGSNFP